jgi:Zn-dependent protease
MLRSWKLGRALGIGIYVHWTFFLLVAYVLYTNWGLGGSARALYAVGLLIAVFFCVVLHELGHALMARKFGISTRDITLYPIGGVARLERMSERPWEEFCIAVAGPAVNVVLALLLAVPAFLSVRAAVVQGELLASALQGNALFDLFAINLGLVLFNLIPAFPMDGGRVLRALLTPPFGRLAATQAAAVLGGIFAVLFVFAGLFGIPGLLPSAPGLLLIGLFLFMVGQQELAVVQQIERRRQLQPLDVIPAEVLEVVPVPSDERYGRSFWDGNARVWVFDGRSGRTYWVD